jgi:hypothetical protein
MRTGPDGVERLAFAYYVESAEPDGKGSLHVKAKGPEELLSGRPLPFTPPMRNEGSSPDAFDFHWRQLDYVFGLPDPRAFPRLFAGLDAAESEVVQRYIGTARDLARSAVLNAVDEGMHVDIEDDTDVEHVALRLAERDRQMGFAALLRHCDSTKEPASFDRVASIVWKAIEARGVDDADPDATVAALDILKSWRKAVGRLHMRSLNQLLRDRLAADEQLAILAFDEEHSPAHLLSVYDYGDLLHWDRKRGSLTAWQDDEYRSGERRLTFLACACALAHAYIGFAVLAMAATDER